MVRPFLVAVAIILFMPLGGASLAPPPPGHVAYEVQSTGTGMEIKINWTEPHQNELYTVTGYRVYMASQDRPWIHVPLEDLDVGMTEYSYTGHPDKAYLFYVASIGADGTESAPSNPVLVRVDYPHCTWLGWSVSPPSVIFNEECFFPPPV